MSVKDNNRAELVKAIVAQTKGRFFSVVAKRKKPKKYFVVHKHCSELFEQSGFSLGDNIYLGTKKNQRLLESLQAEMLNDVTVHTEHFMEMTCRTGVKAKLAGGESTIRHIDDLISVYVTENGREGYRCFSAFNVLSIKAGGTSIKFKQEDVLAYEGA